MCGRGINFSVPIGVAIISYCQGSATGLGQSGIYTCLWAHAFSFFFEDGLMPEISQASHLIVSFGKSLKLVEMDGGMDALFWSWLKAEKRAKAHHLTTCCLGHRRVEESVSTCKCAADGLSRSKITHVSTGRPNLNLVKPPCAIKQKLNPVATVKLSRAEAFTQ